MPTGLTAKIYEGEETSLREFALTCAAQLSPCHIVTDRGSKPMPMDKAPVIKPEPYRRQQLRREEEELERWQHLKVHPDELRKEVTVLLVTGGTMTKEIYKVEANNRK